MTTTFGKIIGAREALQALSNERLEIKEAVALARLLRRLDEELRLFEAQRMKLLREFGTEQDGGITIEDGKKAAFEERLRALLDVSVEIDGEKIGVTTDKTSAATVLATEDFIDYKEGD